MPIADIPEPGWLQAMGHAAGVVLIIELLLLILITAALVGGLAFGLLYVPNKVVPLLTRFAPAIEQRLQAAECFEAVDARKPDVEKDNFEITDGGAFQGFLR